MVEHGRGGVRLEYGRRLFSSSAEDSKPGDITLKVHIPIYYTYTVKLLYNGPIKDKNHLTAENNNSSA